ncbi:MAG: hypothetical protein HY686_00470 [Chloroflexi bacterium]|nr:hypothetical protein [Chloroflexota bacterium]
MSVVSNAIQQEQWEVVAYCLLLGLARAASRIPPEALANLVELLEGQGHAPER